MFKRISIGIKTFLRDDKLAHTISNIEKNFPDAHMIIADDGRMTPIKETIYTRLKDDRGDTIITMPFDSGFGAKSNAIANALERPYLLVASDDFDFSPVSAAMGVQEIQRVLDVCSPIDVISGRVNGNPYEFFLYEKDGIVREARVPDDYDIKSNERVIRKADLTVNYSMIRKRVFEKVRWDDDAKIGQGEHGAFFVDLQRNGFRVAFLPDVNINEQEGKDSAEYKQYRSRATSPERSCFVKRGIKKYILGDGTVDYEEKKKMYKRVEPSLLKSNTSPVFPHCDQRILHAPGECHYCDKRPGWQELRIAWGIAFTGYIPEGKELPDPATHARGFENLNAWDGNKAKQTAEKIIQTREEENHD